MPHRIVSAFAALALTGACLMPLVAQAQSAKAPQIGQQAPDFTLPDIKGNQVSLQDFKGKKNVLLVFYRGWVGYW